MISEIWDWPPVRTYINPPVTGFEPDLPLDVTPHLWYQTWEWLEIVIYRQTLIWKLRPIKHIWSKDRLWSERTRWKWELRPMKHRQLIDGRTSLREFYQIWNRLIGQPGLINRIRGQTRIWENPCDPSLVRFIGRNRVVRIISQNALAMLLNSVRFEVHSRLSNFLDTWP